jgi:Flp pilus assembly protein TadD
MVRELFGCRALVAGVAVLALAAVAAPAAAQNGQIRGTVVDANNKPVEGAEITIALPAVGRTLKAKTNRNGEFIQIGLDSGEYKVTATKDQLSSTQTVRVTQSEPGRVNFVLKPGGAPGEMSPEDREAYAKKIEAVKKIFGEGVALSQSNPDQAIAKFNEVIAQVPDCSECYTNIGSIEQGRNNFDAAEQAFKKANEIKPTAEAYNGLATIYNAQRKFDEAAKASAEAAKLAGGEAGAAGGSASAVYNQGIILWNQSKIPEAKKQFEEAIKLDPTLADAHYWLGMALVNEGKLKEAVDPFETYLKLAPDGQNAATAKSILATIKK